METQTIGYCTDRINEFCEIIHDYSMRVSMVEDDYNRIHNKIESCFQFIDKITVPFVFEYSKVLYQQTFQNYVTQLLEIKSQIDYFPTVVETQSIIALAHDTHDHKKLCIDYLDIILSVLNVSLQNLEYCVDHSIKHGLEAFDSTKKFMFQCR
jgi:hypothetical protein